MSGEEGRGLFCLYVVSVHTHGVKSNEGAKTHIFPLSFSLFESSPFSPFEGEGDGVIKRSGGGLSWIQSGVGF